MAQEIENDFKRYDGLEKLEGGEIIWDLIKHVWLKSYYNTAF